MANFSIFKDLVAGDNVSIEQNSEGNLVISSTGGATEAMYAMLNWENIKASRTFDTEVWTGKMAGTDKVYGKVIDLGALPNATTKNVAHNIANLDTKISHSGFVLQPEGHQISSNFPHTTDVKFSIYSRFTDTTCDIQTGTDRREFTAVMFLEYTCTDR